MHDCDNCEAKTTCKYRPLMEAFIHATFWSDQFDKAMSLLREELAKFSGTVLDDAFEQELIGLVATASLNSVVEAPLHKMEPIVASFRAIKDGSLIDGWVESGLVLAADTLVKRLMAIHRATLLEVEKAFVPKELQGKFKARLPGLLSSVPKSSLH